MRYRLRLQTGVRVSDLRRNDIFMTSPGCRLLPRTGNHGVKKKEAPSIQRHIYAQTLFIWRLPHFLTLGKNSYKRSHAPGYDLSPPVCTQSGSHVWRKLFGGTRTVSCHLLTNAEAAEEDNASCSDSDTGFNNLGLLILIRDRSRLDD